MDASYLLCPLAHLQTSMYINFYAILLSLGILVMKRFSSQICQWIQALLNRTDSAELRQCQAQLKELLEERNKVSITDQFAEYALIDRKINKLQDTMQKIRAETRTKSLSKIMYIKVAYSFLIVLMSMRLIWSNRDQPVIDFSDVVAPRPDSDVDIFAPFNFFVSFPASGRTNCLGVTMWMFTLNRLLDIVSNKWSLLTVSTPKLADDIPVQ